MAKIERIYNIPLRKGFRKAVIYKKSKKAVTTLIEFITKHMKCSKDQLRIGKVLNEHIWKHGIRNPPHHVKVTVTKDDDGIVKAEMFGFKYIDPIKPEDDKKTKTKTKEKNVEDAVKAIDKVVKKDDKPKSEPKVKEDTKVEDKKEVKKPTEKKVASKPKTTTKKPATSSKVKKPAKVVAKK